MAKEDIKAIDSMNYLFTPTTVIRDWYEAEEFRIMARVIFHREPEVRKGYTPAEFVAEMDEAGYDKVFITSPKMYSYRFKKYVWRIDVDEVYEFIKDYPDRLIGMAGYDPYNIMDSCREIEKAVTKYNFKGVYAHSYGYDCAYDDRRMYPLYETCVRLGIPCQMQIGHSLEVMPSEHGRPIKLDYVALDFPELNIIGSHTGWPWCEEMIAMAYKHENVYVDLSAHAPRYLDKSLLQFANTRGRHKTLWGTNGLGLKSCKDEFLSLGLRDETYQAVLRDNAIRVFKL